MSPSKKKSNQILFWAIQKQNSSAVWAVKKKEELSCEKRHVVMWETSLDSAKEECRCEGNSCRSAASLHESLSAVRTVWALTFTTYSSAFSQDFPQPVNPEDPDPWPLWTLFWHRNMKTSPKLSEEEKKVSTPHRPGRARRSSSERAPAPEGSRTGRSRSPRSRTFPGSLPPAWCCCWSAWSRLPRVARWSEGWVPREKKKRKRSKTQKKKNNDQTSIVEI